MKFLYTRKTVDISRCYTSGVNLSENKHCPCKSYMILIVSSSFCYVKSTTRSVIISEVKIILINRDDSIYRNTKNNQKVRIHLYKI